MAPRAVPPDHRHSLVVSAYEVAEALGLHPQTVYRLARNGDLPMRKLGHQWIMTKHDLHALLDEEEETDRAHPHRDERDA
jgi:excisionase family DNA binding protein